MPLYPPDWGHRFRLTIGYSILVVAVVIALLVSLSNQQRIERESLAAAEAVAQEGKREAYQRCQDNNDLKAVILTLTERISAEGGGPDFSRVPGFEELDQNLQEYLIALGSGAEVPGDDRLVRIAREVLVPEDCDSS